MRRMGLGRMGNWSQTVPFFSDFPSISNQIHSFFLHFLYFWQFLTIPHSPPPPHYPPPISPHFRPFPPILPPFPPFYRASTAGQLMWLRLMWVLGYSMSIEWWTGQVQLLDKCVCLCCAVTGLARGGGTGVHQQNPVEGLLGAPKGRAGLTGADRRRGGTTACEASVSADRGDGSTGAVMLRCGAVGQTTAISSAPVLRSLPSHIHTPPPPPTTDFRVMVHT